MYNFYKNYIIYIEYELIKLFIWHLTINILKVSYSDISKTLKQDLKGGF